MAVEMPGVITTGALPAGSAYCAGQASYERQTVAGCPADRLIDIHSRVTVSTKLAPVWTAGV